MAHATDERGCSEEAEQESQDEDWEAAGHQTLCELIAVIHRYLDNRDEPPEGETEETRRPSSRHAQTKQEDTPPTTT